jgi:hypothetical protein
MIPERNGISCLDEMMPGVVRVDIAIEWFVYCIRITVYVLQIIDVAPLSFRAELNARCCCVVFYSQLTSKVTRTGSVRVVVYLECHVVSFEYFRVIVQHNNWLYITFLKILNSVTQSPRTDNISVSYSPDTKVQIKRKFELFEGSALDASFEASLLADPSNNSNFLLICTLVSGLYETDMLSVLGLWVTELSIFRNVM